MSSLLDNNGRVLRAGGRSASNVWIHALYVTELGHWELAGCPCASLIGAHRPARTVLGVAQVGKGYSVQALLTAAIESPTGKRQAKW